MNLKEIQDRQEAIRAELHKIESNPAAAEDTDGDYVDTLLAEFDTLEQRRQPLAARAQALNLIMAGAKDDGATEAGSDTPRKAPEQVYRNRRDPFDNMDAVRASGPTGLMRGSEIRERALDAIEWVSRAGYVDVPHDHAEQASKLVTNVTGVAKHVLLTGSEEYYEAFRSYMRDPEGASIQRSFTLGTGSLGFALPFVLDPTVILTNTGSANPYRRVSRVEQTTSNTWNGVNSAGVNAAMVGEAVAASDQSPTVGQIQITPKRAQAWVFGSYESIDDSDIGLQLPKLFADAKDRLEESAFATGVGTGNIPLGAMTAATTGNTAAVTAYAVADVYTLQGRLGPRFRNSRSAAWMANLFYLNKTRQFDTAGGSSFWANLGQGTPELLLGKPVYESSSLSAGTATGSLVLLFGDFEQFIIVDRIGMRVLYNPMVTAAATANLPTAEAGWFAYWRYGSGASTANALQALRIQ